MGNKNSELRDLKRRHAALRCVDEYGNCNKCSNKELCDKLAEAIKRLEEE